MNQIPEGPHGPGCTCKPGEGQQYGAVVMAFRWPIDDEPTTAEIVRHAEMATDALGHSLDAILERLPEGAEIVPAGRPAIPILEANLADNVNRARIEAQMEHATQNDRPL